MKSRLLFLFIATLFSSFVWAQKTRISGKISNQKNEVLSGVSIEISGAGSGMVRSDVEGRFSFPAEIGKKYTVSFSYVGYQKKVIDDVVAGDDTQLDVIMDLNVKSLGNVTVSASVNRGSARGET
ncbi:MAG: carboxypeptidase-like regulatory domain-containing protein, partial [Sediminibacterium sp.]